MQQYLLTESGCAPNLPMAATVQPQWLDCGVDDLGELGHTGEADAFIAQVRALTGMGLQALHTHDAANPLHPSHYDAALDYSRVVFRGLVTTPSKADAPASVANKRQRAQGHRLQAISTQPITFFISDRCLITVQHGDIEGATTEVGNTCLTDCTARIKTVVTPHQLMLRFINTQVDAYLALRQPLTDQLDRWQRELLDPRRAFNDWTALLDARLELRKLESLAEEQMDALSELREAWAEPQALPYEASEIAALRVRLSDLIEHISRVLDHAKRLESSVESAIQLHFAAVAHQTNHTVRNLTVLTAVFAPLTLLTGFYGMNVPLPWQQNTQAFSWILLGMVLLAGVVLGAVFANRFWQGRGR